MAEQRVTRHRGQEHVDVPRIAPDRECDEVAAEELRGERPETAA